MTDDELLTEILKNQMLAQESRELKHLCKTREEVEALLRSKYGYSPTIRYGGSKAKGTMIRDSYDLDMTCYFSRDDNQAGTTIAEIYEDVAVTLEAKYFVQRKRSALRLTSKDQTTYKTDLHVDVVPGRFIEDDDGDVFLHQNEGDKGYLKTNLNVHIEHVRDSGVTDAIRLMKLWNVRNQVGVKTFVLELSVVDLLRSHKTSKLSKQILIVLYAFRDHINDLHVEDPANPNGNDLSDVFDAARPRMQSVAQRTLEIIEKSGWVAAFGSPEKISTDGKVNQLLQVATTVSTPLKPWADAYERTVV